MKIDDRVKKYIYNGSIVAAIGIIAYFGVSQHCGPRLSTALNPNKPTTELTLDNGSKTQDTQESQKTASNENATQNEASPPAQAVPATPTPEPTQNPNSNNKIVPTSKPTSTNTAQSNPTKQPEKVNNIKPDTSQQPIANNTQAKIEPEQKTTQQNSQPQIEGLTIIKNDITTTAKFYPYKVDNTYMEVIAVKASDGSIRTAMNTCQVCFDSGKGYYKQVGEYLICQNCKNKFHIDQVEKVKGGCNPVPVTAENKKDTGDTIIVLKDFIASQKELFSNWKKF